jgi:hypothetical protein
MVFWLQSASASSSDIGSGGDVRAQAAGSVMGSLTAATGWIASEATATATTFNLRKKKIEFS